MRGGETSAKRGLENQDGLTHPSPSVLSSDSIEMLTWTAVKQLNSDVAFDDYRDEGICCASIYYTKPMHTCSVCFGDHVMVERRLRRKYGTCLENADCLVQLKVRHCTAHDKWKVLVNDAPHARGALPCFVVLPPKLAKAMKEFVFDQDELEK